MGLLLNGGILTGLDEVLGGFPLDGLGRGLGTTGRSSAVRLTYLFATALTLILEMSVSYAKLSQWAYDQSKPLPNGWKIVPKYCKGKKGFREVITINKNEKYIVICRGTDLKNSAVKDLTTDALLAVGGLALSSRQKDLDKIVAQLISVVDKRNIVLTGHSLGGTLAQNAGKTYGIVSKTFNSGKPVTGQLNDAVFTSAKPRSESTEYRVSGDPISSGGAYNRPKEKVYKSKKGNKHGIANFVEVEERRAAKRKTFIKNGSKQKK